MQNELIFELAKEAGFKRITECCPGVENKLCTNDVWKGNLGELVAAIEGEVVAACIQQVLDADENSPERKARVLEAVRRTRSTVVIGVKA